MSALDIPDRDLSLIAPKFRLSVEAAILACATVDLPVKVHEGFRSQARQAWLFTQGRTRDLDKPRVTNAPTSLTSWHGYGLAVDVVHVTKAYWPYGREQADKSKNEDWFARVAAVFKAHDLSWGGDWNHPDTPHMQWGRCTASPSKGARTMFTAQGVQAVWRSLGAT